jgi:hypothetical protein
VTRSDADYFNRVREKMGGYPKLAREALWRREYEKSEEYWRLWHEAVDELFEHFGGYVRTSPPPPGSRVMKA